LTAYIAARPWPANGDNSPIWRVVGVKRLRLDQGLAPSGIE
jgi:hypothetical protein